MARGNLNWLTKLIMVLRSEICAEGKGKSVKGDLPVNVITIVRVRIDRMLMQVILEEAIAF